MAGQLTRNSPESGSSENFTELLKTLKHEELLEVLSGEFCQHCQANLESRVHNLVNEFESADSSSVLCESTSESFVRNSKWQERSTSKSVLTSESDHLVRRKASSANSSSASVNSHVKKIETLGSEILLNDGLGEVSSIVDDGLSEEQKEHIRFSKLSRKKDFVWVERVNGKATNILKGLELHTNVFNSEEQKKIVECVYKLQHMGQKGHLRERTYSEPKKWMRGKGRVTIQFGCCYNYAVDRNGNPPGIIRDEDVDPLPPLFMQMIKRMVRWHVLPPTCIPNSCIVNIYDEGDCIPPHIDHHDFVRPFCTVSFLTECNILFGSNLKVVSAGEFSGPVSMPLPVGSVLILNGNGADVAKHCVPGVPAKRISITFRKMDDSKLPYRFLPDPELSGFKPLVCSPLTRVQDSTEQQKPQVQQRNEHNGKPIENGSQDGGNPNRSSITINEGDFPPLGSSSSSRSRPRTYRAGLKH